MLRTRWWLWIACSDREKKRKNILSELWRHWNRHFAVVMRLPALCRSPDPAPICHKHFAKRHYKARAERMEDEILRSRSPRESLRHLNIWRREKRTKSTRSRLQTRRWRRIVSYYFSLFFFNVVCEMFERNQVMKVLDVLFALTGSFLCIPQHFSNGMLPILSSRTICPSSGLR